MPKKRPTLKNLIKDHTTEIETFQNSVIRPIIKLQNDLLINYFRFYLENKRINFSTLTDLQKKEMIEHTINKDNQLKHFFIGMVVGQFENEELHVYLSHSSEYNKRIKQIIKQRLKDNLTP